MSAQPNDGGPAFPVVFEEANEHGFRFPYVERGASLRDQFAIHALVGLVTLCAHDTLRDGETYAQHVATIAYEVADAMLAERAKLYAERAS